MTAHRHQARPILFSEHTPNQVLDDIDPECLHGLLCESKAAKARAVML